MTKLNIFVSSTCYDLSQIRADLHEALSEIGYNPVLSEFSTFPVNPSNNTLENCIEAINSSADIFVLVIGNRYGYKPDGEKSITNIEFTTARNKKIPIYIFINKQVLSILPVYLKNKNADYSNIVDTREIFEFVNEVRNASGLWSYEFEKYQEIINILKIQLSYLFKESLSLRNKFQKNFDYGFHSRLSHNAIRILLLKESTFDIEFFAQVLIDEVNKMGTTRRDYDHKIVLKPIKRIDNKAEFFGWASEKMTGTLAYIPNINNLFSVIFPKYLNEPGIPSDLEGLFYVANTYARTYESFIEWSLDTLSVSVDDDLLALRNAICDLTSNLIESMSQLPFEVYEKVVEAKQRIKNGETDIKLGINLTIDINQNAMDRLNTELSKLKGKL